MWGREGVKRGEEGVVGLVIKDSAVWVLLS